MNLEIVGSTVGPTRNWGTCKVQLSRPRTHEVFAQNRHFPEGFETIQAVLKQKIARRLSVFVHEQINSTHTTTDSRKSL